MKKKIGSFGFLVLFVLSFPFFLAMDAAGAILVRVKIAWCPMSGVIGYNLYHGVESGKYGSPINVGNAILTESPEFNEGQTQYFIIKGVFPGFYESPPSEELVVNVTEGNGTTDNWKIVRGSAAIGGFDNTYPVVFFTGTSTSSASSNKVLLTGLNPRNEFFTIKFKATGVGGYFSVLLTDSKWGNITLSYRFVSANSYSSGAAIFALAPALIDGQWHTVVRNLRKDLETAGFTGGGISAFTELYMYSFLSKSMEVEVIHFCSNTGDYVCQ